MAKKEWLEWLKCNVLEIAILLLVLWLVINSCGCTPTVEEVALETPEELPAEEPLAEVSGELSAEEAPAEEAAEAAPAEETPEAPAEELLE